MGDAMQAAGVGPEVEYKGRVYQFQAVRVQEIAKFEAWLHRQAFETAIQAETWMPARHARELMDETRRDVTSQVYRFGGRRFNEASVSNPGLKQIALISLKAGEGNAPDIDGELIDAIFKAKPQEMRAALVAIGWVQAPEPASEA